MPALFQSASAQAPPNRQPPVLPPHTLKRQSRQEQRTQNVRHIYSRSLEDIVAASAKRENRSLRGIVIRRSAFPEAPADVNFASLKFLLFSVRRNSVDFASPRRRQVVERSQVRELAVRRYSLDFASGVLTKVLCGRGEIRHGAACSPGLGQATADGELCFLHFASYGCAAPTFGRGCLRVKAAPLRPKVGATPGGSFARFAKRLVGKTFWRSGFMGFCLRDVFGISLQVVAALWF